MGRISLKTINERITTNAAEYIAECEDLYNERIKAVANAVKERFCGSPIIMLSGPSGSGKTTSALKIEAILDKDGLETHTVSMDNYFLPHDNINELDLESPQRLDIELLQEHLVKIAKCEEIEVPLFNFKTQRRDGFVSVKRHKNELVLMEGIHALNPDVTGNGTDYTQGIYVCPSHGLDTGLDRALHTAQVRLLRRLTRDYNFRGRNYEDTLRHFGKVERGANIYVIPYKSRADYVIDSFLPYEVCAYRDNAIKQLELIGEESSEYTHAKELLDILFKTASVDEKLIPSDSLVREFIGGSCYNY